MPEPEVPQDIRDRFIAVIHVLAGHWTVTHAAEETGLSRTQFQTVLHKAISGAIGVMMYKPPGPSPKSTKEQITERENERLRSRLIAAQQKVETLERFLEVAGDLMPRPKRRSKKATTVKSRAASPTSSPTETKTDPEEPAPDPEEARRREICAWSERFANAGLPMSLPARVLGASEPTLRRWRARLALGRDLTPRRRPSLPPRRRVPRSVAIAVEAVVRVSNGIYGAATISKMVPSASRREAADIKAATLTQMERERKHGCTEVDVLVPDVIRGMDGVFVRTRDGLRPALIAGDGAVAFRTTATLFDHYDERAVVRFFEQDIASYGAPLVYRIDRASAHRTPAVLRLLRERGVLVLHGPPHLPRYYGHFERQNNEHQAWLARYALEPPDVIRALLPRMRDVMNNWPRGVLGGMTAAQAWVDSARPNVDRDELRDLVDVRRARLVDALGREPREIMLAERLAIEQTLEEHQLLRRRLPGEVLSELRA